MNLRVVLVLLIAMGFLTPATSWADACVRDNVAVTDGACWRTLSQPDKAAIVRGIWAGLKTRSLADGLIGDAAFYWYAKDWAETAPSTTNGDILEYFDKLYETPANREINWDWAYILASMYTRDDDSNDRLALLKFIREHGELPLSGTIEDIIDESHILILSGSDRILVKIAGISGDDLSDEERKRANNFLNGIVYTSSFGSDCSSPIRRNVELQYRADMFGKENEFTADVKLWNSHFCIEGERIELDDIIGGSGSNGIYLSYLMVSKGLIKPDSYLEQEWTEDTKNIRDYSFSVEAAREKGLYLYGPNVIGAVDKVIAFGAKTAEAPSLPIEVTEADQIGEPKAGSGFFVTPTVAITNAHVVSGCQAISASGPDRLMRNGRILAFDSANDLALIQFDAPFPDAAPVEFGSGRPAKVGDTIVLAGYPLSGLLASGLSVADGLISNSAGIGDDIRMIQITAPVQPGNSGGPVLDAEGVLVGVVTAKLDAIAVAQATGDIPQNVNFAIKASVVRAMLDAYEIDYSIRSDSGGQGETAYDRLKRVSIYVECH